MSTLATLMAYLSVPVGSELLQHEVLEAELIRLAQSIRLHVCGKIEVLG